MDEKWKDRLALSSKMLVDDLLEGAADQVAQRCKCASPIETAFAAACALLIKARYPEFLITESTSAEILDDQLHDDSAHWFRVWGVMASQVTVGPYRVDFAIRHFLGIEGAGGVVIECDGHAFHEKTKGQAAADKERDRFLQTAGYRVFRFTGSEIWADSLACADQVLSFAFAKAQDSLNARALLDKGDIGGMAQHLRYAMN